MKFPVNHGERPSRLELARQLTGEAPPTPAHAAQRAELQAELQQVTVAPFDMAILQAHAARLDDPRPAPRPARRWAWLLLPLLASFALFFVRPPDENRIKGETDLDFYVLRDGEVYPGDPEQPVRSGDRIQFTYRAGQHDGLVLLSVDGTGALTVFYPPAGNAPMEVIPGERRVLQGSILLDDAPGPEVFLAFFGTSVTEARAVANQTFTAEGVDGLVELDRSPDVSILVLKKE